MDRLTVHRYEGQMVDGQPHGQGDIVYLANDKFGRANYTGEWRWAGGAALKRAPMLPRFGMITGSGTMHWKSGARWT